MSIPSRRSERAIALLEAAKGILVLAVGCGLLTLLGQNVEQAGESLVARFHLNPASHYPRVFLEWSSNVEDSDLLWLSAGAMVYAGLRFAEAYGLWKGLRWAEWLALVSALVYVPVELLSLVRAPGWGAALLLALNLAVVLILARGMRTANAAARLCNNAQQ